MILPDIACLTLSDPHLKSWEGARGVQDIAAQDCRLRTINTLFILLILKAILVSRCLFAFVRTTPRAPSRDFRSIRFEYGFDNVRQPNSAKCSEGCQASKPAFRSHCVRPTANGTLHVSEASCPNFEPRAHARLTGLTTHEPRGRRCARDRPGNVCGQWSGNYS